MNATTTTEGAGEAGGSAQILFPVAAEPPPLPPVEACPHRPPAPEPLVRIREEHNVSRRDIDPDALKVLYRLSKNNFIAYLVGGGVRDLLLGRRPKDFDISTNAKPEQIRALFRNCILIGRRFRLAHIRYSDKIIETSTFRRSPETAVDPSDPEADLFQRDDNLFGTPREDALRRDFTVNGLFYDIETFSVIDYVGGMEDLAARRIRAIGDPCIRFREDPVRMIRAIRFASRLDFDLDPDTHDAIRKHADELAKASPARLLEEISRLFAFSAGEKAVRLLRATGLLGAMLPEVAKVAEDEETRHLLWRRLQALDKGDTVLPDATPALIFAALLLDPLKRHLGRDWGAASFPKLRFERVHSFLAPLSLRMKLPRRLVDRIVHIYLAQHRFANPGGKSGSIANFVTQESFHESLALAEILLTSEGGNQARLNQWRDMLAERMYGRDESGGQDRDRRQPAAGNGEAEVEGEGGNEDDGAGDRRISRSARRRRNKRLRRQHGREAMQARETGQAHAAPGAAPKATEVGHPAQAEAHSEPAATAEAAAGRVHAPAPEPVHGESAPPAPPAPTRNSTAGGAATREERKRRDERREPGSSRGRRGRSRRNEPEPEAPAPADQAAAEPFHPLTAAAFWANPAPEKEQEKEPEKEQEKRKPGRRGRSAQKAAQAGGDGAGQAAPADPARPAGPKPLAMDKADEADIPMHWLDEI